MVSSLITGAATLLLILIGGDRHLGDGFDVSVEPQLLRSGVIDCLYLQLCVFFTIPGSSISEGAEK